MNYYYPMMNGSDWGWGLAMMLFWTVFLIIITIFTAVIVVRLLKSHDTSYSHRAAPLDFVKERFAKGEITKEQFEQLKKDLIQ